MGKKIEEYFRNCIWGLLIILLFTAPLTVGARQISIQGEQTASKTARDKLKTRISLSCINKPIDKVLMELSEKAEIDIVKSPGVVGDVTVKVTDVPLEEALINILSLYHFTYIATENMIRVVPLPPQDKRKEPQVTRIYQITYADAGEVFATLDKFVSEKGEVGLNKGTSHIVVTDTEDKIKAIDKFIEQIDRITPQVLVEVRIYDVTTREGFELDPQWRLGRNAPYTGNIRYPKEITQTSRGPESSYYEQFRQDMQWVKGVGINDPLKHYPDPNYAGIPGGVGFGVFERNEQQWTTDPGRFDRETTWVDPGIMTDWRRKPFVGGSFDRVEGGNLSFSVLNDAVDIDLALTLLHSQVEARLLANPRILVLDNETAYFEIVREFPYREMKEVPREDPVTYTAFKNVGVDLKVTPHIAGERMLKLHIIPEFSALVSHNMRGAPIVDTRFADTKAMIKDGQTIVIGGLRRREVTKDIARVPVLSDMPLVGGLFVSETESVSINELIVFITTKIITESTLSESEKKLFDETVFTSPEINKTRIEKGEFEKTEAEESDIIDSLDLLLDKMGPSGK